MEVSLKHPQVATFLLSYSCNLVPDSCPAQAVNLNRAQALLNNQPDALMDFWWPERYSPNFADFFGLLNNLVRDREISLVILVS